MGKKKFRDFDKFWQEKEEEPIQFRVLGREYEIPAAPRAATVLKLKRLREAEGMDAEVQGEAMVDVMAPLLGEDQMERMFADGITFPQLQDVLEWIVEQYQMPEAPEDDGEGEDRGKERK